MVPDSVGSNPMCHTIKNALVVKLVKTLDLGSRDLRVRLPPEVQYASVVKLVKHNGFKPHLLQVRSLPGVLSLRSSRNRTGGYGPSNGGLSPSEESSNTFIFK